MNKTLRIERVSVVDGLNARPKRPQVGASGHSTRSTPERPELVESCRSLKATFVRQNMEASSRVTGHRGQISASISLHFVPTPVG